MALQNLLSLAASLPTRLQRRLSGGVYRPEVDGLRFLAIAIVVVGHFVERALRFFPAAAEQRDSLVVEWIGRPGLGVQLFFCVSGFILAGQAMRSRHGPLTGAFLRGYLSRRVLRIEPPYLILLFVTFAAITLTGYHPQGTNHFAAPPDSLTASLFGSIFYLHGLIWGSFPRLFPPGWSLEVEVQFYLLAPLLFFLYFGLTRAWARGLCGAALLAAGVIASTFPPRTLGGLDVYYSILRFFQFFWLGILLAHGREAIAAAMGRLPRPLVGAAGFFALFVFLAIPNPPEHPVTLSALASGLSLRALTLAATATMFACVLAPASAFRSFCAYPWISLIGGACYSIYLTHLQTLQFVTGQIAKRVPDSPLAAIALYGALEILLVLAVGLAYYAVIERTFMIRDWPSRFWNACASRLRAGRTAQSPPEQLDDAPHGLRANVAVESKS
ncbi:peptidoglycan/LPS O-acetylase OafA/YrhL [Rhodoblastus acidophilus]|uniref:acyltransferase family protein n=1 Tax=Rhodoblastus acidophilus TaxID=1074 RepID=UPI00222469EB|nr:acyltransferase [Rhodoblastus acidophilus]MCW2284471.1 peptidoglycan/LPS O-acetylase OafA/YrhL [Rhodoblastus acidophilus]MCW2333318.1 peptidoglycan/LPS O-acetylase OafA/YrhL [Rhodoblastus acidophilus]